MRIPPVLALTVAVLCSAGTAAQAQDAGDVPVLDTAGIWRVHYTLKLPLLLVDGKVVQLADVAKHRYVSPPTWMRQETPLPPADWMKPDFDDGRWERLAGTLVTTMTYWNQDTDSKCPYMALVCARGKFRVSDPARAQGLTLSVEYRGGVVVYLNGVRIAAGHMTAGGAGGLEELAEPTKPGMEKQVRKLTGLTIGAKHLRKGVNVLAVEVHRHALREGEVVLNTTKWPQGVRIPFAPCGLEKVRLSAPADAAGAVVPNVTRPKGFQVWNSNTLAMDLDMDFGDPNETPGPIEIVGTRNGTFSSKVVVGSDATIRGLRATASALVRKGGGGSIPASRVVVRYGRVEGWEFAAHFRYLTAVHRLEALDEVAPAEVPVRVKKPIVTRPWVGKGKNRKRITRVLTLQSPGVAPRFGAVCPVWVTVNVPKNAAPGDYTGTLTLTAEGEKPVTVPVTLSVSGWTLPDPHDYRTFVDLLQSPETLAMAYEVPMWSDEHFRLIERSLELIGGAGGKTVYLRLICETNLGNAETMIRWIKQPDGTYKHDFTAFDRYMDLVEKHLGRPPVVCLYVWDKFLMRQASRGQWEGKTQEAAIKEVMGKGPGVTVVDPATGKTSTMYTGPYGSAKAQALWKPLADGIMQRVKKRKALDDALMLGIMCDYMPSIETMDALDKLFPGVRWVSQAHPKPHKTVAKRIGYASSVFAGTPYVDPATKRIYGWKTAKRHVHYWRRTRDDWPMTTFRFMPEMTMMAGYPGFARIGADFFPVLKNKRGDVVGSIASRYLKSYWNNLNINLHLLARGEKTPVATARFEMMREGIQTCEARIFIERALTDKASREKLGDDLANRAQEVLDARARFMRLGISTWVASGHYQDCATHRYSWWQAPGLFGSHWYITSGWEQRVKDLYDVAAEVADKARR